MKRIVLLLIVAASCASGAFAQKFALVDMEYILSKVPTYEIANDQLSQLSQRWQKEVEAVNSEAQAMYKDYQANMVFLSDDQKKKKEAEITAKEKEAVTLRNKYFGPEGDLYTMRQKIMTPIQDEIYKAIKAVSEERGFMCVFDRASATEIIFASPRIDISNEVLAKLGY